MSPDNLLQDEAYELGRQWAKYYEPDTPSRELISGVMDTYFLVNVVHNDFKKPGAIFDPFFKAGAEFATSQASHPQPVLNGQTG